MKPKVMQGKNATLEVILFLIPDFSLDFNFCHKILFRNLEEKYLVFNKIYG